jgi:hypothetical protein
MGGVTTKENTMTKRNIPHVENSRQVLEHIDTDKPVRVYRNLHKQVISVKQGGLVRCHADNVVLHLCKFIVSKAGQKRVRDEKRKNVHAYIEGVVVNARETDNLLPFSWTELYYNPYKTDFWQDRASGKEVESAEWVDVDSTPAETFAAVIGFNLMYRKDN